MIGEGWSADPFGGLLREGRIFGRGSADMKGLLVSMMIAAKTLKESRVQLDGNLMIAAVIAEEEDQIGTLHLVDKKIEASFAVVGEPSELQLFIAHKGDSTYEITAEGRSAHSSVPHEGIDAIYKMSKIISAIENYSTKLEQADRNPLLGTATLKVGTIAGGVTPWNVPASCKIVVGRRLLPHETAVMAMKQFEEVLEQLKAEGPELIDRVRIGVAALPMETSPNESIVRTFRQTIEAVTGKDPGIKGVPYTTDGGILNKKAKMPTIVFGPGDIKQAHRPDESIPIRERVTGAKVYALDAANILS